MLEPTVLRNLIGGGWQDLTFVPFKDGIEAHWLQTDPPQVAILRYAKGASAPRHLHEGLETIIVLEGSQSDEFGTYEVGDMVLNPVGSEHSVWSDSGCVVLLQWDKPVRFL